MIFAIKLVVLPKSAEISAENLQFVENSNSRFLCTHKIHANQYSKNNNLSTVYFINIVALFYCVQVENLVKRTNHKYFNDNLFLKPFNVNNNQKILAAKFCFYYIKKKHGKINILEKYKKIISADPP